MHSLFVGVNDMLTNQRFLRLKMMKTCRLSETHIRQTNKFEWKVQQSFFRRELKNKKSKIMNVRGMKESKDCVTVQECMLAQPFDSREKRLKY